MIDNSTEQESKERLIEKAKNLIVHHSTQQQNSNNTENLTYQKITKKPSVNISAPERVQLIQQGYKCLNEKDIKNAKKIFTAIGYNEGLERIARYYADKGNMVGAYLMFRQAEAKEKEVLEQHLVNAIKTLLS